MAFWARKDLYSATPAFIQGLGFCGLVWTTTQFSRLVWQARCTEDYSKLSPQEMKKHLIPKHKLIFKGQNFKGLYNNLYHNHTHKTSSELQQNFSFLGQYFCLPVAKIHYVLSITIMAYRIKYFCSFFFHELHLHKVSPCCQISKNKIISSLIIYITEIFLN